MGSENISATKRTWLLRSTSVLFGVFLLSFIFIFLRGLTWSPNTIEAHISAIDIGDTAIIKHDGKRVWVTRLSAEQRQQLSQIDQYVYQQGGCNLLEMNDSGLSFCMVQSETQKQGVVMRYLRQKPDTLANDSLWIGGYINPSDGAVYDLLGRLYKNSVSDSRQANRFVNIDLSRD